MIELPDSPAPNGIQIALRDFGVTLRPPTGGAADRLNRKGNRHRASVTFPPMQPAVARVFIARLKRAKTQGLRIALPLLVPQGSPGAPVVNGAGQAGTTLNVRGLQPGYIAREGYWLSIVDATGRHYLHSLCTTVRVGDAGTAAFVLDPELRWPFADGAAIHLARPMIEGFVEGDEWSWTIPLHRLVSVEFPIEEAA
jgi:hypothetical protein